jgi:hypothetical protein
MASTIATALVLIGFSSLPLTDGVCDFGARSICSTLCDPGLRQPFVEVVQLESSIANFSCVSRFLHIKVNIGIHSIHQNTFFFFDKEIVVIRY